MLGDLPAADPGWSIAVLRYFNAAGASPGGGLTDGLWGRSTNLIPRLVEVAHGYREWLPVYGNDWSTRDGTCVRDYVHVVDIACAHVAALDRLVDRPGLTTVNLGSGQGYSVLEVVRAFQRASGCTLPLRIAGRRPGDVGGGVRRSDPVPGTSWGGGRRAGWTGSAPTPGGLRQRVLRSGRQGRDGDALRSGRRPETVWLRVAGNSPDPRFVRAETRFADVDEPAVDGGFCCADRTDGAAGRAPASRWRGRGRL